MVVFFYVFREGTGVAGELGEVYGYKVDFLMIFVCVSFFGSFGIFKGRVDTIFYFLFRISIGRFWERFGTGSVSLCVYLVFGFFWDYGGL